MEREIVLSSYSVKNKDNNKPGNFITKFTKPIVLDNNHEYFCWPQQNNQHELYLVQCKCCVRQSAN